MKFYFEKRVVIGFIATVVILVTLGLFSFSSTQRLINTWGLLTHESNVMNYADLVVKHVVDLETAQRGYVITGNEEFLEPFYASSAPLASYIKKLDSLTVADPLQSQRIDTLQELITKQIAWTTKVIEARRESFEKASSFVKEGTGKRTTDKIRQCTKRIKEGEEAIFKQHNTITEQSIQQFQYSFVGFATVILIITLYLFYLINKSFKARNEAELMLNRTAAETRDLYNNAPCGYFSVDSSIYISNINQTLLNWLGYKENEVVGKMKFEELLSEESKAAFLNTFAHDFEQYKTKGYVSDLEFDFKRKDQTTFPVYINSTAVFNDKGEFIRSRSTVMDHTERKKTEMKILQLNQELESKVIERTRKLAESEKIYKSIVSHIPGSAIAILDSEERYLLAEGDLIGTMNYNRENLLHQKIATVISEERYRFYQPLIKRAFAGETIIKEVGTPGGKELAVRMVPLKNDEGQNYAIMIVLIDITEIKKAQAELAEMNNTLEKKVAERTSQLHELNQELESFTYSVSHDLRAPLRVISGYSQLLKEDYYHQIDAEGQQLMDRMIKNAIRMGQLINDLLDFSKLGRVTMSRAKVNMNIMAKEVLQELSQQEPDRKLSITIQELPAIDGDGSLLRQVWINLISNALKYSRKQETTEIEIGSYQQENTINYYVKDNGAGFSMSYADKLFKVFQRLHSPAEFEGTGVGLALVNTIIKRHGGKVWAEGKVNEGATFYFQLLSSPRENK